MGGGGADPSTPPQQPRDSHVLATPQLPPRGPRSQDHTAALACPLKIPLPAAMPTPRALLREEGCWRWGRKRAPGLRPGRQGGRRTRGADPAPRRSPAHCRQQTADTSTAQADGRTAPHSPHPAAPTPPHSRPQRQAQLRGAELLSPDCGLLLLLS